ncbi:MAG: hypothetical protein NC485_14100 [Ruminococcus flavefaciens]|nr:hypothetical protein [Ruminococcus flavefaciens]
MNPYLKKEINKINDFCCLDGNNGIYILESEEGMGKRTIMDYFLKDNNAIRVHLFKNDPSPLHALAEIFQLSGDSYQEVYKAMYQYYLQFNQEFEKAYIIIYRAEYISREMCELLNTLLLNGVQITIFLLMNEPSFQTQACIANNLNRNIKNVRYQRLERWSGSDLMALFKEKYPESCLSDKNIMRISNMAFGNPSIFIMYIDYLKSVLGDFNDNDFEQNNSVLFMQISMIVKCRYDRLDPLLKEIIKKSSIVGNEFDEETLSQSFKIPQIKYLLEKIENISNLIIKKDNPLSAYRFDNEQTHITISTFVTPEETTKWNIAIADYFAKLQKATHDEINIMQLQEYYYKAFFYYKAANQLDDAVIFAFRLFPIYINLEHFCALLDLIKEIEQFLYEFDPLQKELICFYKMKCYDALFKFDKALELNYIFESLSFNTRRDYWLKYKRALYLYNTGNMLHAYNLLKHLQKPIKTTIKNKIKYRINGISLLSAILETMNDSSYVIQYDRALSLAKKEHFTEEYYILMRKANYAHRGELGIPLIDEAYNYYKNSCNLTQQAMAAHNMGTEFLYCLNSDKSNFYLNEAYDIFMSLGNLGIKYTMNSLAIYEIIFNRNYEKAIDLLKSAQNSTNEDFDLMTYMNNKAVCYRKMGQIDKCGECISWIEKQNSKSNNNYDSFNCVLNLQKAYFWQEKNDIEKAYSFFLEYIRSGHSKILPMRIAAIINMVKISEQMRITLPPDIEKIKKSTSTVGEYFYEQKFLFCNLQFWE